MVDWTSLTPKNVSQDTIVMPRNTMPKCTVNVSLEVTWENTWNTSKKKITPSTNNNSLPTLPKTLKPMVSKNCTKVSTKPSVKILLLPKRRTSLPTNPSSARPNFLTKNVRLVSKQRRMPRRQNSKKTPIKQKQQNKQTIMRMLGCLDTCILA